MKSRTKRLISLLLVFCMLVSVAPAEGPEQGSEGQSTQEEQKTEKPEQTEKSEETEKPEKTEDPEKTENPEKTEDPQKTEDPEKTEDPQKTEDPEKTEDPQKTEDPEKTEDPQHTEDPEHTEDPQETGDPTPTPPPKITVKLKATGKSGTSFKVQYSEESETFTFEWNKIATADTYAILINDGKDDVLEKTGSAASLTLNVSDYLGKTYTMTISAVAEGVTIVSTTVTFVLEYLDPSITPTPTPSTSPRPTFKPNRRGGFAGFGGETQKKYAFDTNIVSGKALTSRHAQGTKDMTVYDTVKVQSVSTEMTYLTFGTQQLNICLDSGEATFTAKVSNDTLTLCPGKSGEYYDINMESLETLKRSGISQIELVYADSVVCTLDTSFCPVGREYSLLRASGLVSGQFYLTVAFDGTMYFEADGSCFTVMSDGTLEKIGG